MYASLILYAALLLLFSFLCAMIIQRPSSQAIPKGLRPVPGPPRLPIIGNTHQIKPQPQRQMEAWARQYGELFRIQLGWNNWIFISSPEAVKEILDKQSAVTSSRVPSPVTGDIISGGMRFLLMDYSPPWRKLRTIVHQLLTPKATAASKPSQEFEAKQLLHDILNDDNEEDFYKHVRRYTISVVMTSTYGKRIPRWDCDEVREVYGIMHDFSEYAAPGAFLAEVFPPLAKLPVWMQWWRKRALVYYRRQERLWLRLFNELKDQMAIGRAPECFVRHMIESQFEKQGFSQLQGAFLAGSMIEAGSETTSSTLNSAIKYLAATPKAQNAAHKELDRVIGPSRTPTFDDEEQLPYIRAIVKEILRIRPITNIGTPHATTKDVVYKDMLIPKGSPVAICQYAIHFDPDRYDEPYEFKPERYLNYPLKAGVYAAHSDPYQRDHFSFGAGRRICPGMHLSENSLYITLAKTLWAFRILPPSELGDRYDLIDVSDAAYGDGADTVPKLYKVRFEPRREGVAEVIEREWRKAEQEGFYLGGVKVDKAGVVVHSGG